MFAVIVNTLAIIAGALIGLLLKKGLPKKLSEEALKCVGLCTIVIGVQGAVAEQNILILIVSAVLGLVIGQSLHCEDHVNGFCERLLGKITKGGNGARFAQAFVTSCLIMNVGAMVIVGSLDAGLRANYTMLYTKSLLDFISGIMLTATMGAGVFGSALFTLVFQGAIVLCAQYIAPYISDELIEHLCSVGSLLILALGLNMVGLTKFKVIDYLPALAAVPFVVWLFAALPLP